MTTRDPVFVARLDRVQASAEADLDKVIVGFRMLREGATENRETDLAVTADLIGRNWTTSRAAFALMAAVDRLTRTPDFGPNLVDCPMCDGAAMSQAALNEHLHARHGDS